MPEPTFFTPPPDAGTPEKLALYSHGAGLAAGAAGSLVAFGRAKAKGTGTGIAAGIGLASVAAAAFAGVNLYNGFLYKEYATPMAETPLFLMAAAGLGVGLGVNFIPGLRPAGGGWRAIAIPAMITLGFALAGISQLSAVGIGAAPVLGIAGGLLAAASGVLFIIERRALARDAQAGVAMPIALALVGSGVLTAVGTSLCRSTDGASKGALALALAEAIFAGFTVVGLLAIAGSPKDFPKPVKAAVKPGVAKPTSAAAPPPPPGAPGGPARIPGGPTRVPGPPPPPGASGPTRPSMPPPPPGG